MEKLSINVLECSYVGKPLKTEIAPWINMEADYPVGDINKNYTEREINIKTILDVNLETTLDICDRNSFLKLESKPWTEVGLVLSNTYQCAFKDILDLNINPKDDINFTVAYYINSFIALLECKLNGIRYAGNIVSIKFLAKSIEELKNVFISLGLEAAKDIIIDDIEDEFIIDQEERLESVKICNLDSQEMHHECKILGSVPDGIVDMNTTPHQFAVDLFKKMIARHWVAEQINMAKDANAIKLLSKAEKHVLKLILNHLTNNDSDQTAQLSRIKEYISSPMVNNALARQEFEECVHSESYSRYLKEALEDDGTILYMHRPYLNGKPNPDFDNELLLKNKAVSEMYLDLYKGIKPTKEDMLIIFVANQILEELVFPGGFVACYILGEKLRALTEMIAEINKDGTQALVA